MTATATIQGGPAPRRLGRRGKAGRRVLPGFGLSMGFALTYLSLIVLIPLAMVFVRTGERGWAGFVDMVTRARTLEALKLSFSSALIAAAVNAIFGTLIAWTLTRFRFPGRRAFDAIIDIPFALPTAVAGIALASLFSPANGLLGEPLKEWLGLQIAYVQPGIVLALVFVTLPFVVRTVQPVLADLDRELEEAAVSLGASRWQSFARVVFPVLLPAILTGFSLAFARAVGEYGSVIFIAGNLPYKTEIAPLLIVIRLEEYNYAGATAIAAVMLTISFAMLLVINALQAWTHRRAGGQ